MRFRAPNLIRIGIVSATLLVLALCALEAHFSYRFLNASSWVRHTAEVLHEIRDSRLLLASVEYGPQKSQAEILDQLERLAELTGDNPRQGQNLNELRYLLASGMEASAKHQPIDPSLYVQAFAILGRMQDEETRLLTERTAAETNAAHNAAMSTSVLCVVLLLLGLVTTLSAEFEFRRRTRAEESLELDKQELEKQSHELELISTGSKLIQTANDEEQINQIVALIMEKLLPGSSGYLGVVSPSKDLVEISASWGDGGTPAPFLPSDCTALQLGRPIHRSQSLFKMDCKHAGPHAESICEPLQSSSGHLGILYVAADRTLSKNRADAVALFASHLALGLTNLRMRELLKSQSVRDPLTGLFNRRYFDETLQREFAASLRNAAPFCVLMLDVDHFKQFNDNHGHAAGDEALRTFGHIMLHAFREGDLVCRFGGEEFAVILSETRTDEAAGRAESFRSLIAESDLRLTGGHLGRITASIGIACSVDFKSADELLRGADVALYRAKRTGRNRVCLFTAPAAPVPSSSAAAVQEA